MYHFKAIEILCSFVSDCSLLNHFLSSYQKNYTPNLETITEEETLLEMSLRDLADQSRPQSTLDDSTPILARQSLQHEEYRAGNKPTDKKKRQTSKLDVLKNKFTFKKLPKLAISVGQQRPRSNEKGLMVPKRAKLTVSVEQMGTKNRMGQPVRSNSPALATKAEKSVKRKGLNNRTVQQILEGINLDKHKLDEFIKSQGFRPINEAAAKIASGLLSKKASAGKLHIGPQASRGGSRKASSSRTKCSSPQASQSQTERPRERQTADSGGQSLNIKIENKDFVARMMNINIIKIKPDTRSDQCFCRKRFDKPGERKKSAHLQTNLSSGTKSRGASTESKAEKNKNGCGKADDNLFRSGTARPNKSKETQSRNASRKDSSSLQ